MKCIAAAAAVAILLWALIYMQLSTSRQQLLKAASTTGRSLALLLAEQQESSVRTIDLSLQHLRAAWQEDPRTLGPSIERQAGYLERERIIQVAVVDAEGWMTFSRLPALKRVNFADRAYFQQQKAAATDGLIISDLVLGRITRQWAIQFSRPIFAPDKQFAGMIVMALPPPALEKFYATVGLGDGASISLLHADGTVIARSANSGNQGTGLQLQDTLKKRQPDPVAGEYQAVSPLDGVERLVAYRRLGAYPLTVAVAQSLDDVLTPYYKQRRAAIAIGSVVTALLFALAWLLAQRASDLLDRRKHALLRDADRRKSDFMATLSHELRDPLGTIRLSHSLLEHSQSLSPRDRHSIDIIGRQTSHLTSMVNDLLDVTRIEQGIVELRHEQVDLRKVVEAAVESVSSLMSSSRHVLQVMAGDEPVHVSGDFRRLSQVFSNLLANSARYTPSEGAIAVLIERSDVVGRREAVVRVRDNGEGIAPEQIERIFEPFVRSESTEARVRNGLGLGLTLCRRLVELHGGSLTAHSEGAGKGTEMLVRLPLAV